MKTFLENVTCKMDLSKIELTCIKTFNQSTHQTNKKAMGGFINEFNQSKNRS